MVRRGSADHVTCFDHFSLAPHAAVVQERCASANPFDQLFRNPFERQTASKLWPATVPLLPGIEVLDLYRDSELSEIWKDGQTCRCLVPRAMVGWEFFSLLWPQPGGTSPLKLSPTIELLGGRPPKGSVCPSVLFALVPQHYLYPTASPLHSTPQPMAQSKAQQLQSRTLGTGMALPPGVAAHTPEGFERISDNLDGSLRTKSARLLVLCPCAVYEEASQMPADQNWGLFIGPRSRSLVLLNKHRGRIDLHLATLLAIDAVYRMCEGLIAAVARLFSPFGSQDHVPALFGPRLDPLKIHSGLTNAAVADHINVGMDGRNDYQRYFGIRLPFFFLSNASNNLCFLTPLEAQQQRAHDDMGGHPSPSHPSPKLVEPGPLPAMPRWTLHLSGSDQSALEDYRAHKRHKPAEEVSVASSLLQHILGLHDVVSGGGGDAPMTSNGNWFSALVPNCTEVTPGGAGSRVSGPAAYGGASSMDGHREALVQDRGQAPGFAGAHASSSTQHGAMHASYIGADANHAHQATVADSATWQGHSHTIGADTGAWPSHAPASAVSYGDSGGAVHYHDDQPSMDYYGGAGNAMGALGEH